MSFIPNQIISYSEFVTSYEDFFEDFQTVLPRSSVSRILRNLLKYVAKLKAENYSFLLSVWIQNGL